MTTTSPRLGLIVPTDADPFVTEDLAGNWTKIDAAPGTTLVDNRADISGWGSSHEGMLIYERTSDLHWRWTGAGWTRAFAKGWLNGSSRTTIISTSSTTPVTAVSAVVTVPAGGRRLQVTASWFECDNSAGRSSLTIFRDAIQIAQWTIKGDSDVATDGDGGSFVSYDVPGTSSSTYSFRLAATGTLLGTTFLRAAVSAPTSIDIVEV